MDTQAIQQQASTLNALISALHAHGMRPLPGADRTILAKLTGLGITASASAAGYLELSQQGVAMVVSPVCEALRTKFPELFVSDTRWDAISSKADFHGSPSEILKAKAEFLSKHGLEAFERLPQTRAAAELRSVTPSADMSRKEYLSLTRAEKAELISVLGASGIERIMARTA
jgi:hypothetical protein